MKLSLNVKLTNAGYFINGQFFHNNGINAHQSLAQAVSNYIYKKGQTLNGVFNKDVYWPLELQFLIDWTLKNKFTISPSDHMLQRAEEYGITKNCYKAVLYGEIVEATVVNGLLFKIVTRLPSKEKPEHDICAAVEMVMFGTENYATVRTVWLNRKDDRHLTLRKGKYVQERDLQAS